MKQEQKPLTTEQIMEAIVTYGWYLMLLLGLFALLVAFGIIKLSS